MNIPDHLRPYYNYINEARQQYTNLNGIPSSGDQRIAYREYLGTAYQQLIDHRNAHPAEVNPEDDDYLKQWFSEAYEMDYQPTVTATPVIIKEEKSRKEPLLKRVQKAIDKGKLLDVSKYATEEKTSLIVRPRGKSSKIGSEWLPIVSTSWDSYYEFMRHLLEEAIAQYGRDNYDAIARDLFPVWKDALINFGCFHPSDQYLASELIFGEADRFANQRVPYLFQASAVIPPYPLSQGYGSSTFS